MLIRSRAFEPNRVEAEGRRAFPSVRRTNAKQRAPLPGRTGKDFSEMTIERATVSFVDEGIQRLPDQLNPVPAEHCLGSEIGLEHDAVVVERQVPERCALEELPIGVGGGFGGGQSVVFLGSGLDKRT